MIGSFPGRWKPRYGQMNFSYYTLLSPRKSSSPSCQMMNWHSVRLLWTLKWYHEIYHNSRCSKTAIIRVRTTGSVKSNSPNGIKLSNRSVSTPESGKAIPGKDPCGFVEGQEMRKMIVIEKGDYPSGQPRVDRLLCNYFDNFCELVLSSWVAWTAIWHGSAIMAHLLFVPFYQTWVHLDLSPAFFSLHR